MSKHHRAGLEDGITMVRHKAMALSVADRRRCSAAVGNAIASNASNKLGNHVPVAKWFQDAKIGCCCR